MKNELIDLEKYKVIVFDFDGVILDSASIKTEAFRALFNSEELVEYHIRNTGIARKVKFRYYLEKIAGEPVTDEKLERLNERFKKIVLEKIRTAPLIPGVPELLERYWQQKPLYICSGTPRDELEEIIAIHRIRKYFRGVYGQPREKPDILREIFRIEASHPGETVFIGDGISDYEAARSVGAEFLVVINDDNREFFKNIEGPRIESDFRPLLHRETGQL